MLMGNRIPIPRGAGVAGGLAQAEEQVEGDLEMDD